MRNATIAPATPSAETPARHSPRAAPFPATPALHPVSQRFGRVHSYILDDGHGLTVIDALGDGLARPLLEQLASLGRAPGEIRNIILTHAHLTHVKGAWALKRASGARVFAPAAERDVIEGRRPSNQTTWIPRRPWRVWPQQYALNVSNVLWRLGIRLSALTPPPVVVDTTIVSDGQRIGPVIAFKTPGHTPGSTSFYWPETETLFAGDALVTWPRLELGWRGLTEDYAQNVRSIRALVTEFESRGWSIRTLATGHGPPIQLDGLAALQRLLADAR
ncbi:MAG: MBL fold metallo-hydrolase [Acidobacteria bacterium]|nr:MBL fold metallo-hydrolase [Acidobacteriota bacterium]